MGRVRTIVTGVLLICLLTAVGLFVAPMEGWYSWVAKGIAIVSALFAMGAAVLLAFTLFPAEEDLWKTSYFRYMRKLWKSAWGGDTRPYAIGTCQAIKLSAVTAAGWLIIFSLVGLIWYANIAALASNLKDIGFFLNFLVLGENSPGGTLIFYELMMWMTLIVLTVILITQPYDYGWNRLRWATVIVPFSTSAISLLLALTAVPIMHYGLMPYLIFIGSSVAILVATAVVVLIMTGLVKVGVKISGAVQLTVPGRLLSLKKEGLCPLIIEGAGEQKQ